MKKSFKIIALLVVTTISLVSCFPEDINEKTFDETLLFGKWQSGTLYYKYIDGGTGTTWDTADDVTEEEAQSFTWTLEAAELTHIYILEIGGSVPKVYTVTELTETTLTYEDDFGVQSSFSKVTEAATTESPAV